VSKSPRPRAKAVAKGFDVASEFLGTISGLVTWIFDQTVGGT
jgi:hypothetical protein